MLGGYRQGVGGMRTSVIVLTIKIAPAGVAQWFQCQAANQRVNSLIPSLGHVPGLQARPPVGGV